MYLANDVIQNSKKKGPEYGKEFGEVLTGALKHMAKTGINAKTKHSLHRILDIWQERGVYDAEKIQELKVAGMHPFLCFACSSHFRVFSFFHNIAQHCIIIED